MHHSQSTPEALLGATPTSTRIHGFTTATPEALQPALGSIDAPQPQHPIQPCWQELQPAIGSIDSIPETLLTINPDPATAATKTNSAANPPRQTDFASAAPHVV
jgi:hypothetical protein